MRGGRGGEKRTGNGVRGAQVTGKKGEGTGTGLGNSTGDERRRWSRKENG